MRGADLLVKTLAEAGVTTIFSLSGNQIMPVYDACIDAGITIIHTRHEGAAVFMAEAWAQLTGGIGVALVTAAPGAANAMGAVFSARASETPVLLLTGDAPRGQDGMGAFQELDQIAMSAPLTKHSARATAPGALGEEVAEAIRIALSGRPGPVHLALPFDVVQGDAGDARVPDAPVRTEGAAARDAIEAIRAAVGAAARPLVLCGPSLNATRTGGLHARLADALDAPVAAMESPRGLRDPSLGGIGAVLSAADVVLSLGKPVDFTLGFGAGAPDARWIIVDDDSTGQDRARRALGPRLVQSVEAPALEVAQALAAGTGEAARADWRADVAARLAARAPVPDAGGAITPAVLCAAVQRAIDAAPAAVLLCDGGEFGQWAQACLNAPARVINGPSGAIGGSLCHAVAAAKARPGAAVFALMGDGTAGFHFAEFETAAREGAAFVAIIGNDQCWNAEHQIQLREYGPERLIGCGLSDARYDLAVAGLGGHGEYVTDPGELDAALARAAASGRPACVNVALKGLPAPAAP